MPLTSLYLCYLPVTEPLVETQVVSYLRGLAAAGHRILLVTWEAERLGAAQRDDIRRRLQADGIEWHPRRYHKRPTLLATAYDVLVGIVTGAVLVRRRKVGIVHVRNHVPGAMALAIRRLTGASLLFDIRGLMAEEYVDGGIWAEGGTAWRLTKWVERRCVAVAAGFVVLTERARPLVFGPSGVPSSGAAVEVIPTCADVDAIAADRVHRQAIRAELGLEGQVLIYVGKFSTWYLADEMAAFFARSHARGAFDRFLVLTQSPRQMLDVALRRAGVPPDAVVVRTVAPGEVGRHLAAADAAISFIAAAPSKAASSPTKIAEYLAAGLPVVVGAGVGDTDALIAGSKVGVVVPRYDDDAYDDALDQLAELRRGPAVAERCVETARRTFSMELVGIPRYRSLYDRMGRSTAADALGGAGS